MKNKTTYLVWGIFFFVYPFVLFAYSQLQQEFVILHWNAVGEADGYGPKWIMLCFPLVIVATDALFLISNKIDKKRRHKNRDVVISNIRMMLASFLALFSLLCCALQFDIKFLQVNVIMSILTSFLFLFLGNILPRVKQNWIIGIRTPWTLANDRVWTKTHRLAGRLWFFGSFIMMVSIFLPSQQHLTLFFTVVFILCCYPCMYSYILFRKEKVRGE